MLIQLAHTSHADGIAEIYNDAVLNTTAIWNETQVDAANRVAWMLLRETSGFPVLVALDDDRRVMGYGSFGDFRPFDGYRHTVEHSVYVHRDARRGGVGRALLQALVEEARQRGKHVMVGAIESGNQASIQLHAALGFEQAGCLRQVGKKFGRWLDLTFMQRVLEEEPSPPSSPARP